MRALAVAMVLLALAGCPSRGGCPVDTISSASQCIPVQDAAVRDLSTTARDLATPRDLTPVHD